MDHNNSDTHENQTMKTWFRGMLASRRQSRKEHRFVLNVCKETLALYRYISVEHPELGERERIKLVVMSRKSCDEMAAYDVLKYAEGSYATWPVKRELNLCDVIHYLGITKYSANTITEHWMHSTFGSRIKSIIPTVLCKITIKQEYVAERRKISRLHGN